MTATRAASTAFRKSYLAAGDTDFDSFNGRLLRYEILEQFARNDAYNARWAAQYRTDYGLYAFIRNVGSVGFELSEFWSTHLMGGPLDLNAGDGDDVPSALPIVIPETNPNPLALRVSIGHLWRNSRWDKGKAIYGRTGNIKGDVGLEVIDDTVREKVYLRVVDPAVIADVDTDVWGNVKGYTRQEKRKHPERSDVDVTYTEVVTRDGDTVVYRTFLNDRPYAWPNPDGTPNTNGEMWSIPYGFVPLVMAQHIDVGDAWGWGELYTGLTKMREVDDLGSLLDDQIRKLVNAPWLFNFKKPTAAVNLRNTPPTAGRPESAREEMGALYIDMDNARGQALVAPMDLAAVNERLARLDACIERQYPEIQFERLRASGALSGIALRVARQPAETKVINRRSGYDDALARVQQMAVAIGGMRGYEGFEPFGLESYAAGQLDHTIGPRPVFALDPLDRLEEDKVLWDVAESAGRAGLPLALFLEGRPGWDAARIARLEQAIQERQAVAAAVAVPNTEST